MVLGLVLGVVAVPSIVGVTEAIKQGQRQNEREEHRGRKSELVVSIASNNRVSFRRIHEIDGAMVVLLRRKLWIRTNTTPSVREESPLDKAHPFTGYFLKNRHEPEWHAAGYAKGGEGLVSTIYDDPPVLNWIYVHGKTHEIKYGTREEADTEGAIYGPWDVTAGIGTDRGSGLIGGGRRMTLQGWEGFVAVEEPVQLYDDSSDNDDNTKEDDEMKLWALYFDIDDDGLSSDGRIGSVPNKYNMLEVQLTRRELRRTKEAAEEERADRLIQRKKIEEKQKSRKEELGKEKFIGNKTE